MSGPFRNAATPDLAQALASLRDKIEGRRQITVSDFNWAEVRPGPNLLPRSTVVRAIGQFHHGEVAAARVCADLLTRGPDSAVRQLLEMQCDDERRHAEIYGRYLQTLGETTPNESVFAAAAAQTVRWRRAPEAVMLACHMLLEVEALYFSKAIEKWIRCPVFRALNGAIARDESQHVALGHVYLANSLSALSPRERVEIYGWLRDLWWDVATRAAKTLAPRWMTRPQRRAYLARLWTRRADALVSIGLVNPGQMNRPPARPELI